MGGFTDPNRDLATDRTLELDNGNSYHIHQPESDPYGFWYVHMDKGQVPAALKGRFTSYNEAVTAVSLYLQKQNTRTVVNVKEKK